MRSSVLVLAALAGVSAIVACGIDLEGTRESDATPVADAGNGEASLPPPSVPPVANDVDACTSSTCGLTVPPGWSIVSLTDGATTCPAGFTSKDVVENPVAPAAACGCTCQVSSTLSCKSNTGIPTKYDDLNTATCNATASALVAVPDGNCKGTNLSPGKHELMPAPAPVGTATCAASATADKSKVTWTSSRVCVAPSCADACGTGAFKTCLLAAGDQACPAGVADKHLVGTDVGLACPACSCTTSAPTTCTGNWTLYSDGSCNNLQNTVPADQCTATSTNSVSSYRWNPNAITATCTPTPAAGTASLLGLSTICCK